MRLRRSHKIQAITDSRKRGGRRPFRNATVFDKEQFLKMRLNLLPGSQGNTQLRAQYERPLWVLANLNLTRVISSR